MFGKQEEAAWTGTQWEYKTITFMGHEKNSKVEEELNALGAQGWEVFACMPQGHGGIKSRGETVSTYVMKRSKG